MTWRAFIRRCEARHAQLPATQHTSSGPMAAGDCFQIALYNDQRSVGALLRRQARAVMNC
ncbi:hypothetical protein LAD77_00155 [Klebsiella pneumoniae]|nr:hypothetical protein [Klebsiella pneumoniae]